MRIIKQARCVILSIAALLLFVHCGDKVAGNASEVGNPTVAAMLYNANGTPAAHATVRFYKYGVDPRTGSLAKKAAATPVDSTTTNASGNYTAALDTGTYNILATGSNGNATFQDSIAVAKDSTVNPPTDTLQTPGSLQGRIALQPGDDARTVFILFLGTNTFFEPADSLGNFTTLLMAKGKYQVRILTTLDAYTPKDTVLSVTAGAIDTLPGPIVLQYTGIPVPSGLKINYDTLKQIVTLTWNKPATGRTVKGYNIYRMNVDSNTNFATINPHLVTDTVYSDSTGVQDQTYQYRVAAVDTNSSEGTKSATVSLDVVSAFTFIKNFGTVGTGTGQLLAPAQITIDGQGRFWLADGNRNKIMCFDNTGTFLTEWGVQGDSSGQLNNPYGIVIDAHQNIIVCEWDGSNVQKFDTLGNLILKIDTLGTKIHDVSADENGNIYFSMVTGSNSNYVCKYDSTGKFLKSWQLRSTILHYALLVRNNKVYSAGTILSSNQNPNDQYVIEVYDTAGTFIMMANIQPPSDTNIIQIRDLGIDATGNLYAVDPDNYKVRVFDPNLNYITSFGRKGNGMDEFSSISGIAISTNEIAITDMVTVHLLLLPQEFK